MAQQASGPGDLPNETVEKMFMESVHVTWYDFAMAQGWHPGASRNRFPVQKWVLEKRRTLAKAHADEIREAVFDHRTTYRRDVLKTLKEYPATADAIHNLLRLRVNQIHSKLSKDGPGATETVVLRGKVVQVPVLDSEEILKLSMAMKTITESKHRSLLLSDIVAKVADQAPPDSGLDSLEENQEKQSGMLIEVMGMGPVTLEALQRMHLEYIDRPQNQDPLAQLADPSLEEPKPDVSQELLDLDKDGTDVPSDS